MKRETMINERLSQRFLSSSTSSITMTTTRIEKNTARPTVDE